MAGRTSYWAFQANPKEYDIQRVIGETEIDTWRVLRSDVRKGDRAVIWKSQANEGMRGVVALAEVLEEPTLRDALHPEYYEEGHSPKPGIRRALIKYFVSPMLPLWVGGPHDAIVSCLSVNGHQGPVFIVQPEQWRAIMKAMGGWPERSY